MPGLVTRQYSAILAYTLPASLSGGAYHHSKDILEKSGMKVLRKLFFRLCLATAGFDKQQRLDGNADGDFSSENRFSSEKQADKKLVHNRVGVIRSAAAVTTIPAPRVFNVEAPS